MTNTTKALLASGGAAASAAAAAVTGLPPEVSQLGLAGGIIAAVLLMLKQMQSTSVATLKELLGILQPVIDNRADLARIEAKLDRIEERLESIEHYEPPPQNAEAAE